MEVEVLETNVCSVQVKGEGKVDKKWTRFPEACLNRRSDGKCCIIDCKRRIDKAEYKEYLEAEPEDVDGKCYYCPECKKTITNFCWNCGQKVVGGTCVGASYLERFF